MATQSSNSSERHALPDTTHKHFFVMREFLWGAVAGAFGEGMMHPVDTVKTRIQSQAILSASQKPKSIMHMVQAVWAADGLRGFYRGIAPCVTGSLATGATYFGVIESTKKWIEESHPSLEGHWAHFIAGAVGDTLGSVVYVPCEVMKQRMQVQGTMASWSSVFMKDNIAMKPGIQMYGYYTGMFHAGCSIWNEQGLRGLYAGYWSTLARDVPFAGLMVGWAGDRLYISPLTFGCCFLILGKWGHKLQLLITKFIQVIFYEGLKDLTEFGKQKYIRDPNFHINSSVEGLVLGGLAGGISAYLTTPLDVIKTRLQGSTLRYKGWLDAIRSVWRAEGAQGMFRGSIPRITWDIPASALTFMAVEFLREHFNEGLSSENTREVASMSVEKKGSPLQGAA